MITYRVISDGLLWRVKMDDGAKMYRLVRAANRRLRFWWTEAAAQNYADEMNAAEKAKEVVPS